MEAFDPDVVWEDEYCLYMAYQIGDSYAVHLLFDPFIFDDMAVASDMLSAFGTIIDEDDYIEIVFICNEDEDDMMLLAEDVVHVIIELAKEQDNWVLLNPIEKLELYGKVLQ